MEIKYKYLYKKMFGIHETEDIKEVNGMEYRISLDLQELDKIKQELGFLKELRQDYLQALDEISELKDKNRDNEEQIKALVGRAKDLENDDVEYLKEKIKNVQTELNSVLKDKNKFDEVNDYIENLIIGLEKFKLRDKNDILNVNEIINLLKDFNLESGIDKLILLINNLRNYINKFLNEKNEIKKENEELRQELNELREDNQDVFAAKKQVQNFKEVIDRKQRNIKKLKLEIEALRNKKGKQHIKDISLEYEGDSVYRAYKSYDLKKINRRNYKGEEVILLPISSEKSKEEVLEYIDNSHLYNPKLDELKSVEGTIIWKIQTKNGYWQVILAQK